MRMILTQNLPSADENLRREESPPPQPAKEESPEPAMPTVMQVCDQWGLNDVDLEYSDADYTNLTTYKLFQQTFRPRIQAENPKVPMSKLMMLVAAKWREFTSLGRSEEGSEHQEPEAEEQEEQEVEEDEEVPEEVEDDDEEDEVPLSSRGKKGRGGRGKKKKDEDDFDYDEEYNSDDGYNKKKGRGRGKSKGKAKGKAVPKLKIKLGGRKKKGSDSEEEEKAKGDSDEEFENMLAEAEDAMGAEDVQVVAEARKEK